jgi:hypothetical protein
MTVSTPTTTLTDLSSLADLLDVSEAELKRVFFSGIYEVLPKEAAKTLVLLANEAEKEGKKSIPVKRLREMAFKLAVMSKDEYMAVMEKTAL